MPGCIKATGPHVVRASISHCDQDSQTYLTQLLQPTTCREKDAQRLHSFRSSASQIPTNRSLSKTPHQMSLKSSPTMSVDGRQVAPITTDTVPFDPITLVFKDLR